MNIKKFLKQLFCKHKYVSRIVYTIPNGKQLENYCKKCGKVKDRIIINEPISQKQIEDCRQKGWNIV